MHSQELVNKANEVKQPSDAAAIEYEEKRNIIVDAMNSYMKNREDIHNLIGGEKNLAMMEDNHNNHSKFMLTMFKNYNGEALVKTISWVLSAYPSHGFAHVYWPAQLNGWRKVLENNLSESSFKEILPIYDYIQTNIPLFEK